MGLLVSKLESHRGAGAGRDKLKLLVDSLGRLTNATTSMMKAIEEGSREVVSVAFCHSLCAGSSVGC